MCNCNNLFINNGYACLYTDDTKYLEYINNYFRDIILEMNGEEYHIPALIEKGVLEKCNYFESFPQHLTAVATVKTENYNNIIKCKNTKLEDLESKEMFLTPAACLHIYPMLEGRYVRNKAITTRARVYRFEEGKFEGLLRLWDFTVRELVFVGTREYVAESIDLIKDKVIDLTSRLGLPAVIAEATDHFYPSKKNTLKAKIQQSNSLKFELIVNIKEKEVAIASFNFHDTHFSKSFKFDNNGEIVTGCVGFGLERWVEAMKNYNVEI